MPVHRFSPDGRLTVGENNVIYAAGKIKNTAGLDDPGESGGRLYRLLILLTVLSRLIT